jgi:hypothetical protein
MIDLMAQSSVVIEAPAGISENAWYPAARGAGGGGAALDRSEGRAELGHPSRGRSYLAESVLRLWALMRLEPGWDSYGAQVISPRAVEAALAFLVQSSTKPRPSVVPTSNGGIQLEWHNGRIDIEIECMPNGNVQLSCEDADSGESVERWVAPGHIAVDDWLAKLRPQAE